MTRQPINEWRAEVNELKAQLDSSPDDLKLAKRFWELIGGAKGYDIRDGRRVIDTFRAAALKSDEGLAELIHAFRRLAEDSGEYPRASLFDPPLENHVRFVARQTDHRLAGDATWLLSFLEIEE